MLFSSDHQVYLTKWQLSAPSKKLETHSSFLYWCLYDNQPAVLKIYKAHSDEATSAKLLIHYNDHHSNDMAANYGGANCGGAGQILQHDDDACLLAQIGIGRELVELTRSGQDAKATNIFCSVVKTLHSATAIDIGLKPIDDFIADFDVYLARDSISERDLVAQARQVYVDLSVSQGKKLNLHGDLHHYNIMQTDDENWLAIDPKGYWGEAEYELGAFLRNPLRPDYIDINMPTRLKIIENQLGYDIDRVKRWAFCQAVLASIWADDDMVFGKRMVKEFGF